MAAATLTSKGQITVPVVIRTAMQVEPGDRLEFVEVSPGRFEVFAATGSVQKLKGMFGKPNRVISVEEMNEAIGQHVANDQHRIMRQK